VAISLIGSLYFRLFHAFHPTTHGSNIVHNHSYGVPIDDQPLAKVGHCKELFSFCETFDGLPYMTKTTKTVVLAMSKYQRLPTLHCTYISTFGISNIRNHVLVTLPPRRTCFFIHQSHCMTNRTTNVRFIRRIVPTTAGLGLAVDDKPGLMVEVAPLVSLRGPVVGACLDAH
jgi:hypothetical protein